MAGPRTADARQVGGDHYKKTYLQHWDLVEMFMLDYYQSQITRYLLRWKDKDGLKDLEKARHYLDKYIEVETVRKNDGQVVGDIIERLHSQYVQDRAEHEAEKDIIASMAAEDDDKEPIDTLLEDHYCPECRCAVGHLPTCSAVTGRAGAGAGAGAGALLQRSKAG